MGTLQKNTHVHCTTGVVPKWRPECRNVDVKACAVTLNVDFGRSSSL